MAPDHRHSALGTTGSEGSTRNSIYGGPALSIRLLDHCAIKERDHAHNLDDLTVTLEVFMASCNRCGRCYRTQSPIDPPHPRTHHEERVTMLCGRDYPAEIQVEGAP